MELFGWDFHIKALIQAKGFLKIIQFLLAIITFSILAGYTANSGVAVCVANNTANVNQSALLSSAYPFATYDVARTIIMPGANERTVTVQGIASTPTMISAGRQAMFFVAWGVITLFYCIIAVLVYVVTMAKADDLGRIYLALVYTDFGFTLFWCFMWLVASAEWASGQYRMLSALQGEAVSPRVTDCALPLVNFPEALTLLQSNIAVVFGFLNLFVWLANIWWVLIDCPMYTVLRAKILAATGRGSSSTYDTQ